MLDELTVLGIGSNSFGPLDTTALLLHTRNEGAVLIDCGPNTPRKLKQAGVGFLDVGAVIITHGHLDHCLGLPYFLFGRDMDAGAVLKEGGTPRPLTVIAPTVVWQALLRLLGAAHPDLVLRFDVKHIDITESLDGVFNDFTLRAIKMDHAVPTYGLLFADTGGKKLAYSSDSLPVDAFNDAAHGVAILVHEAMVPASEEPFSRATRHSTAADAGAAIRGIEPQVALLVHLRPPFYSTREALEAEASAAAGMPVKFPAEGASFTLTHDRALNDAPRSAG